MKADGKYIHNIDIKIAYICRISQNIGIFYLVLKTHFSAINRTKTAKSNFWSTLNVKIHMK